MRSGGIFLDEIDMVLIMTVNPGYGGQAYIDAMDQKIRDLRKMADERGLDLDIEVDGGVTADNIGHNQGMRSQYFCCGLCGVQWRY